MCTLLERFPLLKYLCNDFRSKVRDEFSFQNLEHFPGGKFWNENRSKNWNGIHSNRFGVIFVPKFPNQELIHILDRNFIQFLERFSFWKKFRNENHSKLWNENSINVGLWTENSFNFWNDFHCWENFRNENHSKLWNEKSTNICIGLHYSFWNGKWYNFSSYSLVRKAFQPLNKKSHQYLQWLTLQVLEC